MKTFIIATDFSDVSDNATKYGICMAIALDATVILFHAYELPVSAGEVPVVMVPGEEIKNATEKKLMVLKKEMEAIAPAKLKIDIKASLGPTFDNLQELSDKIKPFAVVMGTHSMTGIERVLFGSTTLKVINHLTWPVIGVPPGKQFGDGIKKIGFACDLHAVAKTTPVPFIKNLVKELHAELHVLNADINTHDLGPDIPKQSKALHAMLKEVNPRFHYIQHRDIEEGINEFADANNLDLLITIPKKHKWLESIFSASSSRKLVLHSHIPVMCLHE